MALPGALCHREHRSVPEIYDLLRGSVQLIAGVVTRAPIRAAEDLGQVDYSRWRDLRCSVDRGRQTRAARTRYRHDRDACLAALESQGHQQILPY
ncbi:MULTISPECIES: hypothetical protein [Methylobacterium]|uniref:hypothetical protein n=1 Tax=Methylobacterium TaxID=407 RepID=UPI0013EE06A3|nr:hypothetical protein [Methylobacterium sp. DB0501]NGM38125.1 hypothetical protein [Methylobacterium sp. DB0501]